MRLAAYRLRRRIRETRVGLLEKCRSAGRGASESLLYYGTLGGGETFRLQPNPDNPDYITITYSYDPKHPLPFLYTHLCEDLSSHYTIEYSFWIVNPLFIVCFPIVTLTLPLIIYFNYFKATDW